MHERHVFRPSRWLRLWHIILGVGLCMTAALAPIGLWLLMSVIFKRVEIDAEGVKKGMFGGAMRFDQVARWGRFHQARRRDTNGNTHVARDYVVLQARSGKQLVIFLNDFSDSDAFYALVHERLGAPVAGVQRSWFRGPHFPALPKGGG